MQQASIRILVAVIVLVVLGVTAMPGSAAVSLTPLAPGKQAIDYLDLLFAAWASDARRIPSEWIFDTLEAIWSAWTPDTFASHLATLRSAVRGADVALVHPVVAS